MAHTVSVTQGSYHSLMRERCYEDNIALWSSNSQAILFALFPNKVSIVMRIMAILGASQFLRRLAISEP